MTLEQFFGTDQPGWLVLLVMFVLLEFEGLANKDKGDSWSEVLRYLFGFSKRQKARGWHRRWRQILFWSLAAWFTGHIGFGL